MTPGHRGGAHIASLLTRDQMTHAVVQVRPAVESNLKEREDAFLTALSGS